MANLINKYVLKASKVYLYPERFVEEEIEEIYNQSDIYQLKKRIDFLQDSDFSEIAVYEGTLQRIDLRSLYE